MKNFRRSSRLLGITFFLMALSSCSGEPDERQLMYGPNNDIVYVVEMFHGSGAPSSDDTNIYAMSEENKQSRRLVLSGENLDIKKIVWKDATNVVICLTGGITSHYSNLVTVPLHSGSTNIHNHLVEDC